MTSRKGSILVVCLGLMGLLWFWQHRAETQLREENQTLRRQSEEMAALQEENVRLSNDVAQANAAQTEIAKQLQELPRLRAEASALRRQTNGSRTAPVENPSASPAPVPQSVAPLAEFDTTNDSIPFAGYLTPVAAMQTMLWAAHGRDFKEFLECLTPEARMGLEKLIQQGPEAERELKAKMAKQFAEIKGVVILDQQDVSESQALLHNYVRGPEKKVTAKLRKIGDEWKLDGFPGD